MRWHWTGCGAGKRGTRMWRHMVMGSCLMWPVWTFADVFENPAELSSYFETNTVFWQTTSDRFLGPHNEMFFKWLSRDKKDALRYPAYGNSPPMTFLATPVPEVIVEFMGGIPKNMRVSLYNRGDVGVMGKKEFISQCSNWVGRISGWAGGPGVPGKKSKIDRQHKFYRIWNNPACHVEAAWGYTEMDGKEFRPEFIQITFTPASGNAANPVKAPPRAAGRTGVNLKKNAVQAPLRGESGDVCLSGIPMVDQGDKGYCVAATLERLLRYYGREVNQHEMAQLVGVDSAKGGSHDEMLAMLKRAGPKLRVRVRDEYMLSLLQLMDQYNHVARKHKTPPVVISPAMTIDLASFRGDIVKEVRFKDDKSGFRKFQMIVKRNIDSGIPVTWGVQLGWIAEEARSQQGGGGHLRLIIGYNVKTGEIIYTDSWGAGHEAKRLKWDDAWAMTVSLTIVAPR
jgi:hypothetical protein